MRISHKSQELSCATLNISWLFDAEKQMQILDETVP